MRSIVIRKRVRAERQYRLRVLAMCTELHRRWSRSSVGQSVAVTRRRSSVQTGSRPPFRAVSSVRPEHLAYTEGVGGSSPSPRTMSRGSRVQIPTVVRRRSSVWQSTGPFHASARSLARSSACKAPGKLCGGSTPPRRTNIAAPEAAKNRVRTVSNVTQSRWSVAGPGSNPAARYFHTTVWFARTCQKVTVSVIFCAVRLAAGTPEKLGSAQPAR